MDNNKALTQQVEALQTDIGRANKQRDTFKTEVETMKQADAGRTWATSINDKIKRIVTEDLKANMTDKDLAVLNDWYTGYSPRGASDADRELALKEDLQRDIARYERAVKTSGDGGRPPAPIPEGQQGGAGGEGVSIVSPSLAKAAKELDVPIEQR